MKKKRKSTPVVFGKVSDEALLMQRQIEEPVGEGEDFSWLSGKSTVDNNIQPTGRRKVGSSAAYAPLNHEHPTALISTSDTQEPVENEIRFDGGGFLRRRVSNTWQLIPPFASTSTPQPTGATVIGTSLDYSRADHSHATALLLETNSQTPVERELRYNSSDALVMRVGSNWVPVKIDWVNVLNKPTNFPITVRQNSGSNVGTRPRLNFIEGSNITITVADDSGDNEIDITIASTGGGGSINPYNTTPQPTGVATAGTSTDYSRGDHSHATALIAQSNTQTPVSDELRYNSAGQLVRRDGSSWVVVGSAPVRSTNTYGEQGQNNGEIWYRSNDRAVFFRIGGQMVYPAAALFTTSESAVATGAGNRLLLLDSNANNLLRIGGSENLTVFAYPKLPVFAGSMSSSNANWSTGAGTAPTGALWFDNTSTLPLPRFYINAFTQEPFYVGRLLSVSNVPVVSRFNNLPQGMADVSTQGTIRVRGNDRDWTEGTLFNVNIVNDCRRTGTETVVNLDETDDATVFIGTPLPANSGATLQAVELGDTASNWLCYSGYLGQIYVRDSSLTIRAEAFVPYRIVSNSSGSLIFQVALWFWRFTNSGVQGYRKWIPALSDLNTHGTYRVMYAAEQFTHTNWEIVLNGASQGTGSLPADNYFVSIALVRWRQSFETSPRRVIRVRQALVRITLPCDKMMLPNS